VMQAPTGQHFCVVRTQRADFGRQSPWRLKVTAATSTFRPRRAVREMCMRSARLMGEILREQGGGSCSS